MFGIQSWDAAAMLFLLEHSMDEICDHLMLDTCVRFDDTSSMGNQNHDGLLD